MRVELNEIPGLDPTCQTHWKIRSLALNVKDAVQAALVEWSKTYPDDLKAILKVMKLAAQQRRVQNPKHVKKSKKESEVYEMIAYTGVCRLMFFYDEDDTSIIVCTTPFEKGKNQDAAFNQCGMLRAVYLKSKSNLNESRNKNR